MANKPTLIKGLIKIDVAIQTILEATKDMKLKRVEMEIRSFCID